MPEHLIVNEPYVTVLADDTVPCILVQLYAFANREQFRQFMLAGLAYYQAHSQPHQPWGWIADTRHMSAIPKDVQEWLAQDWNVQAYRAGLREMSIVAPLNITGKLATQQYAQLAVAQPERYVLVSVYYNSLDEAKQGVQNGLRTLGAAG